MKLAVIFPGLGYHKDKPLLYFAGKLARQAGYEVITIDYGVLPETSKEMMEEIIICAIQHAKESLANVDFSKYEKLLFISKSLGTAVATRVSHMAKLPVVHICYTPLEQTFTHPIHKGIFFHGTADSWANVEQIKSLCKAQNLPLCLIEDANHSLERADPLENIEILYKVIRQTKAFLSQERML